MQQTQKSPSTVKSPSFSELYASLLKKDLENLKNKKIKKVLKEGDVFYLLFEKEILKIYLSKDLYRVSVIPFKEITGKKAEFSNLVEDFKIKEIENPKGERIFIFHLRGITPLFEPLKRKLIIELLGRFKNIIVTDENGKAIYDFKNKWKNRAYSPPSSKIDIFDTKNPEWENYAKKHYPEYLKYFGKEKFKNLLKELKEKIPENFYLVYENKKPVFISPWKIGGDYEILIDFSSAIEKLFEVYEKKQEVKEKKEDKKIKKKIENLEKKLEKEKGFEKYRKMGELCLLYRKELEGKKGKFKLKDPEEEKEYEVEIKENPLKSARMYFRIYKNKKQKVQKIIKKIEELRKKGEEKEKLKEKKKFLEFKSPSGFKIYVSRNKEEANQLTFHLAKPWDYFFHIRGYSGPHVILKRNKNQPVPDEDLFYAAKLAVKFAKKKGKVEVIYTRRENVKPLRGKQGRVKVHSYKTIWISGEL